MIIEQASVTFENGDKLTMKISGGFVVSETESGSKIEITYGERMKGRFNQQKEFADEFHFVSTGSQYFNVQETVKAYEVFVKRSLSAKPYESI